ncbi:hypothetical protein F5051DRAFT_251112 [Lentinula edodes]|nr:hypothetical protein F5051DRAFT_251112 [Lentinula edodes]
MLFPGVVSLSFISFPSSFPTGSLVFFVNKFRLLCFRFVSFRLFIFPFSLFPFPLSLIPSFPPIHSLPFSLIPFPFLASNSLYVLPYSLSRCFPLSLPYSLAFFIDDSRFHPRLVRSILFPSYSFSFTLFPLLPFHSFPPSFPTNSFPSPYSLSPICFLPTGSLSTPFLHLITFFQLVSFLGLVSFLPFFIDNP